MEFKKQKPIYQQIADGLCERIVGNEWPEGDRMASVREVAVQLGVNPNTVLRAFDQLQSDEVIFNRRGVGYFVSEGAKAKIVALQRREFLDEELPLILQKMQMLGISQEMLQSSIDNISSNTNNNTES